jgi:hypothetical protein
LKDLVNLFPTEDVSDLKKRARSTNAPQTSPKGTMNHSGEILWPNTEPIHNAVEETAIEPDFMMVAKSMRSNGIESPETEYNASPDPERARTAEPERETMARSFIDTHVDEATAEEPTDSGRAAEYSFEAETMEQKVVSAKQEAVSYVPFDLAPQEEEVTEVVDYTEQNSDAEDPDLPAVRRQITPEPTVAALRPA